MSRKGRIHVTVKTGRSKITKRKKIKSLKVYKNLFSITYAETKKNNQKAMKTAPPHLK